MGEGWETTFMMAQAAGDLGAVVCRRKCDKSMGWGSGGKPPAGSGGASTATAQAAAERCNVSREAG
jgi:hypothetical protein